MPVMRKAGGSMAHYTITHSCGHEKRVNLVGKHSSREWRLERMQQEPCFECYKQAASMQAVKEAEAQELPPLHGSEAQVAWAETLRIAKLQELEQVMQYQDKVSPDLLQAIDAMTIETSAHQWIEWRDISIARILHAVQAKLEAAVPTKEASAKPTHQAISLGEATLRPEKPRTETVAEILVEGNTIFVYFPEKRDDFREIVRFTLGYEWKEQCWQRTINPLWHGTPQDRASELGHALLAHGFSVRCFDEALRSNMASGAFTPECTRWIKKRVNGVYKGWLTIEWGHDDCYAAARKIRQSRYDKPMVVVPPEEFEAVLDFAQLYHFQLSEGAKELVEHARITKEHMLVVRVDPMKPVQKMPPVGDVPPVLAIPEYIEIADELKESDVDE